MAASGLLGSLAPPAPPVLPGLAGDYNLQAPVDDGIIPQALGLLQQLRSGRTSSGGRTSAGSPGVSGVQSANSGTPGTVTSLQGSSFHLSPQQDSWFRTALSQLGLPDKWRVPMERQAATESGLNPNSPMHNTLVGLMQQDTGQYGSMWRTFPGLRPHGENLRQAYSDPVYAVETAAKYILGQLPGYGGYGDLYNFLHRGKTGY